MTEMSPAAFQALFAQQTDEVFLQRLKIEHPNLRIPLKVVHDTIPCITSSGTAADSTENALDGTVVGATWVRGLDRYGAGLQFASDAHEVTLPQINLGNEWTAEVLHRPVTLDPNTKSLGIMYSLGASYLAITDAGAARLSWYDTSPAQRIISSANGLIKAGKKYHFTGRHTGTTTELLVDGVVVASTDLYDSQGLAGTGKIGRHTSPGWNYSGIVSDVRLWNVARSVKQIADSYRDPLYGDEEGLVAWYALNDGAYLPYPFDIRFPDDVGEELPTVELTIDNIDPRICDMLKDLEDKATVTVDMVMASSPTIVEAGPFPMELRDVKFDQLVVTGELGFEDILNDAFPKDQMTPVTTPGLF